jgi:hypothetical protein
MAPAARRWPETCSAIASMLSEFTDAAEPSFLRTVFDTMPIPAFIVDEDVRIQGFNTAAGHLLGPEPQLALHRRGGDALHCINSEAHGCGQSAPCRDCVIRNSVNKAVTGGATHRQIHRAELRSGPAATTVIDLLITASPLPGGQPRNALLILEDISELLTLRGLLPVCAYCKKVRDDDQYWHDIEAYLHTQMHMNLTHGLCPACFAEQMKAIERLNPRSTEPKVAGNPGPASDPQPFAFDV